jgi:hypothetical protein
MSPALAIAAVAALFLVLIAPLALAAWKAASVAPIAAIYAVLLSLIAGYQSGLFSRTELPNLDVAEAAVSGMTDAQCAEILSLLDRAGAIIDRRRPPHLVVAQDRWSQLPEAGQEAVVDCVQRSWPRGAAAAQIEARAR